MTVRRRWQPLVDGELRRRALAQAQAIGDAFAAEPLENVPSDLGQGKAGMALALAYLDEALPDRGYGSLAQTLLDAAVTEVAAKPARADLYGGFVGVAWVAEHLAGASDGAVDVNAAVDELVAAQVASQTGHFDLIMGLAGLGCYALERGSRPSSRRCLALIVDELARRAEEREGGLTWSTPPDFMGVNEAESCPDGNINLGLAHGQPGVIAFLAAAATVHETAERARPLLRGAVDWMLDHGRAPSQAHFAAHMYRGVPSPQVRMAWCYGDPGVVAAFSQANVILQDERLGAAIRALAHGAAAVPYAESGVTYAGFCHGSAGLSHVFNRLYQSEGDALLGDAARTWLRHTLNGARPGQGIGGYVSPSPDDQYRRDPTFLTGALGIALALVAAATEIDPAWDRTLLLSHPD